MLFKSLPNNNTAIDLLNVIVTDLEKYSFDETLSSLDLSDGISLYGAGDLGLLAKEYCEQVGIKVNYVIDINAKNLVDDKFWQEIPVFSPDEISNFQKQQDLLAICIVTIPYLTLYNDLVQQGWQTIIPFYDLTNKFQHKHPLNNGWYISNFDSKDISNITSVMKLWADDISRAHHLQFIAWHLLRQEWIFDGASVDIQNRYFIPQVMDDLTDNEVFLDIGAHHGKVTDKFINLCQKNFKQAWLIEPDDENYRQLISNIDGWDGAVKDKLHVLTTILGKTSDESYFFQGLGYMSQLSSLSQDKVSVKTLDELNLNPTLIKLHLEGAELSVLKGALKTIQKYRPKIVMTSYHNSDGLWKSPLWLMDTLKNYQFYMRLHSWCGTGAVIYALPN